MEVDQPKKPQPEKEISFSKENSPVIGQRTSKGIGRFWYLFLILGLLIIAAVFYLWSSEKAKVSTIAKMPTPTAKVTETEDENLVDLEKQSDSDEIEEIENDLSTTDLSGLDQELDKINEELSLP